MNAKKVYIQITLILLMSLMSFACAPTEEKQPTEETTTREFDLRAYLPLQEDMTYNFRGEGIAFPSLEREIMFVEEPFGQILDKHTGTFIASVYEVKEDEINLLVEKAEFYEEDNLITKLDDETEVEEIIITRPIRKGASWETGQRKKEIITTNDTITVPAGTFYDVIQIKTTDIENEKNNATHSYYAKNIGLIKQKTLGDENDTITILELESYGQQ